MSTNHDDCNVELFGQAHEVPQVLAELLLALRQLPTTRKLHAKQRCSIIREQI